MKICLMEEKYILIEEESQVEVTLVMLEGLWVCFGGRKIYEIIQLPLYFQVEKKKHSIKRYLIVQDSSINFKYFVVKAWGG